MTDSAAVIEPGLQADQRLIDRAWLRIGIGLAVAGQTMLVSLGVNLTPVEGASRWVVHGVLIACTIGVLVFLGRDLVASAWKAFCQRRVSVDLLFFLTLCGAFGGSLVSTFTGVGSVYYELVAVLIVVHTAGRMLGARSRVAALNAANTLRVDFSVCRVKDREGREGKRAVREIVAGDIVLVAPGEAIAVDGEIVAGRGFIRETALTGEWAPASRGVGDAVLAGTYSVDGYLQIRPSSGTRRIDQVLTAIEQARIAPSRLQEQADHLIAWFLPIVASVCLLTFLGWWWFGPWEGALFNAMAVLLVACPCALGLATPVSVWGGLAKLASFGVIARTGDFLDALARVRIVCLDKTGTLSEERLRVVRWVYANAEWERKADWLCDVIAAAERDSPHPVARAFVDQKRGLAEVDVLSRELVPGQGLLAHVRVAVEDAAGKSGPVLLRVGLPELHPHPPPDSLRAVLESASVGHEKLTGISLDGEWVALAMVGETWRTGLDDAIAQLQAMGIEVKILTGDPHPPPDLPVPVSGGLLPGEKQAEVRALQAQGGDVLFVGDGVNDAAAMSEAAASVAMGDGSDLAKASAMAVFVGQDLRFLPESVRLAHKVIRSVRSNLRFAASYNSIGMVLAASGILHPVVAAFLMVGSSIFVSTRALRNINRSDGLQGN